MFNVSEGLSAALPVVFAFVVLLAARVVFDEFPVAVCADAATANPAINTVDNIIRFIIITFHRYANKCRAKIPVGWISIAENFSLQALF